MILNTYWLHCGVYIFMMMVNIPTNCVGNAISHQLQIFPKE
jgi:hypothetical protein